MRIFSDSPLERSLGRGNCLRSAVWMRLFITIGVHMLIYFACDFTSDLSEGRVWPEAAVVPISLMDFRPLSMRCISSWDKAAHFATGERFMRPIEPCVCFPTVVSRSVSG